MFRVVCRSLSLGRECGRRWAEHFAGLLDDRSRHEVVGSGPQPAPMPKGTCLLRTTTPVLVPYFVTNRGPRTLLTCLTVDIGMPDTICLPQYCDVRCVPLPNAVTAESPIKIVRTKRPRRSASSGCRPWISASVSTYKTEP